MHELGVVNTTNNYSFKHCLTFYFLSADTINVASIGTDRWEQTVQSQIRLLLMEQSDQGLHCLLFHTHLFECSVKPYRSTFTTVMVIMIVAQILEFLRYVNEIHTS